MARALGVTAALSRAQPFEGDTTKPLIDLARRRCDVLCAMIRDSTL